MITVVDFEFRWMCDNYTKCAFLDLRFVTAALYAQK